MADAKELLREHRQLELEIFRLKCCLNVKWREYTAAVLNELYKELEAL